MILRPATGSLIRTAPPGKEKIGMSKQDIEQMVRDMAVRVKEASRTLAALPTAAKNKALIQTAQLLMEERPFIAAENEKDLAAGREKNLSPAMLDRLALSDTVMESMVSGLREVASLPDPVGEVSDMKRLPSGITVGRMRIPLGVVGMIYESRPNVTIDAAALCLKAGNGVLLRGGSEAIHSNLALAQILGRGLEDAGINPDVVQVIPSVDREAVTFMLDLEDFLDVIIPRGGEGLIRFVTKKSRIPVLKHYKGVCHAFVDQNANIDMAVDIIDNAKTQRPGVCNALEGLLVHRDIAGSFLPVVAQKLTEKGVELRGCPRSCSLFPKMVPAAESDWGKEFLDLILAIRIVDSMKEAIAYIDRYGSRHTETIITRSYARSQRFLREVDASAVMINASTRFNDGGQFGLGAEIGISTTKLHAYGPMGLEELTTRKFIVYGNGEVRR